MIKTEDLCMYFSDVKAVDRVSMHVEKGSIYGLVGQNGAGKTTMIRMLAGIYSPTSGTIMMDNKPIDTKMKERLFYLPDFLYYDWGTTVSEMIDLYSDLYPGFEIKRTIAIRDALGLKDRQKLSRLSKGMKKQVAFMLGLSICPDVMILDEPIDGLDPIIRKLIWSMIMQDVTDRQMTVLISSHNLKELEGTCDTIGILHQGKLLGQKSIDAMKEVLQKVQVSGEGMLPIKDDFILHKEQVGSLHTVIIRGTKAETEKYFNRTPYTILSYLPLSLEEIFLYEIGGAGYEIKDILL